MTPIAAGVMHQTTQREIDAGCIEQRQGQRVGVFPVVQTISNAIGGRRQVSAWKHAGQCRRRHARACKLIALLNHIRVRDVLLADADFNFNRKVAHQRHQLLQQVFTKGRGMGDGDAVRARQLHFGVRPSRGRDFAIYAVGQAQFRVTEQRALLSAGFYSILQVTLEGLTQGRGCALVQSSKPVDGLFSGGNGNKSFGHDKHPVF